ncbi:MAG: aminotransferase class I/II-fold pyridoxal phosphate-dependent enzyme [Microbacteriaceae bacterium]
MSTTATAQVRAGYRSGTPENPTVVPIYQSASYDFADFRAATEIFALERAGNLYSRTGNPTNAVLERRIAALDGGVAALALASGQAATAVALLALARSGQHIVASNRVYGGTADLIGDTFADFGIRATFVDPDDVDAWSAASDAQTRAWFVESVDNPLGSVPDLRRLADAAHALGVPLVVDNTVATPALLKPIEHGADVVVYSATKALGGHGAALAGLVVDAGSFDFRRDAERWPQLTSPSARFGGLVFATDAPAGTSPYIAYARARLAHDLGPALSAHSAFLVLQGIETLDLRVQRQAESAVRIAAALERHPAVARVHHAGLPTHPDHRRAARLLRAVPAVFSFDIDAAEHRVGPFIDALRLFTLAANIGDARSLVAHPATMTHSRYTPEQLRAAGIGRGTIRLSIGLEDPQELIADLHQALAVAVPGRAPATTDPATTAPSTPAPSTPAPSTTESTLA